MLFSDGEIQGGETCDGSANGITNCRSDCTYCGDGSVNGDEVCDGTVGCSNTCDENSSVGPCGAGDLPVFSTRGDGFGGTPAVIECDGVNGLLGSVSATSCAADDSTLTVSGGVFNPALPSTFCSPFTTSRIWTATNCVPQTGSVTQSIQIVDTTRPTFTTSDQTITKQCDKVTYPDPASYLNYPAPAA